MCGERNHLRKGGRASVMLGNSLKSAPNHVNRNNCLRPVAATGAKPPPQTEISSSPRPRTCHSISPPEAHRSLPGSILASFLPLSHPLPPPETWKPPESLPPLAPPNPSPSKYQPVSRKSRSFQIIWGFPIQICVQKPPRHCPVPLGRNPLV